MVSLASAVGVPILTPDRDLVPAVVICLIIIGMSRLISAISTANQRFERVTQGDADILVEDAVLQYHNMQRTRITRERVFAHIRSEHLTNLGNVRRMYIEADGIFTIINNDKKMPGLSVLPDWDIDFIDKKLQATSIIICRNCGIQKEGHSLSGKVHDHCSNCGAADWTHAVEQQP